MTEGAISSRLRLQGRRSRRLGALVTVVAGVVALGASAMLAHASGTASRDFAYSARIIAESTSSDASSGSRIVALQNLGDWDARIVRMELLSFPHAFFDPNPISTPDLTIGLLDLAEVVTRPVAGRRTISTLAPCSSGGTVLLPRGQTVRFVMEVPQIRDATGRLLSNAHAVTPDELLSFKVRLRFADNSFHDIEVQSLGSGVAGDGDASQAPAVCVLSVGGNLELAEGTRFRRHMVNTREWGDPGILG